MKVRLRKLRNCRKWLTVALYLCLAATVVSASAQNARLQLDNLEKLNSKAAEVNDITLDGALLDLAANFAGATHDPDAAELKDILKGVKGIYIKNFEFDEPNQYSPEDVAAIRSQLAAPGWTRIVESRSKHSKEHDEIYILKQGDKVAGLAILVAEPKELTVVNIVGFIDINKLSVLEGHFGIPDEEESHHDRKNKTDHGNPPENKQPTDKKGDEDDAEN